MNLYAYRDTLVNGITISIVEHAVRNGGADCVWGERDCATPRREMENRENAGRIAQERTMREFRKEGIHRDEPRTFSNKWLHGVGWDGIVLRTSRPRRGSERREKMEKEPEKEENAGGDG